jgi:hypothetical protein
MHFGIRDVRKLGAGLLLAAAACAPGEDTSALVQSCRKVCQMRDMCIQDTDLLDCEKRCDDQGFRSALYYQAKAKCVSDGDLACDQWAKELDNRGADLCLGDGCSLDECVQRALATHQLSDTQKDYCQSLTNKLVACDHSLDTSDLIRRCSDTLLELSDSYVSATQDCVDMSCTDEHAIPDCLDDLAQRYGTDIKVFGDLN